MTIENVAAPLAQALAAKGYESLTAVQDAVLVDGVAGRDLLVSAQTGSGKTVAFGIAIADELLQGAEQLLYADTPLALVIAPTQGIHTFGMRFSLDVVFADRFGHVVRIAEAVPPSRVRLAWRGFAAIELAAGSCQTAGLRRGDKLVAQPA